MPKKKKKPEQYSCEEEAEFRRALDAIPPPPPPDGGWGWMVVAGAFFVNFIVDGVCFSFGLLLPQLQRFNDRRAETALVGSLLLGCCLLSGPLTSALVNRYGCRRVAMFGALLSAMSFVGATGSQNMLALCCTYGVLSGFGYGMMYLPSILCVGLYFEKRRALATAIAVCGSGLGTLAIAPLAAKLLDVYEWQGALVFVAGLALNGMVAGAFFRPLDDDLQRRRKVILRKLEADKRIGPRTCHIMQRLLAEKSRQRTMSTGSLNDVVIDHDNKLLRGEELAAAIAADAARKRRKRTVSASLLDRVLLRSAARSSSISASARSSPVGTGTPLALHRVASPSRLAPSARPLRQVRSVGGRLSEHQLTVPSSAAAAAALLLGRDGLRSAGTAPLPPRNASSRSLSSSIRQPNSSGGCTNPASVDDSGDSDPPAVVVTIEDSPDVESTDSTTEQPDCQQTSLEQWPASEEEVASSRYKLHQLKRKLQQQDSPLYRQDIFYSGSIVNLPQFQAAADVDTYLKSITAVPSAPGTLRAIEPMDSQAAAEGSSIWEQLTCVPDPIKDVIRHTLDFRSLGSPTFLLFTVSSVLTMLGFFAPFAFLLEAAVDAGIDENSAPYLISVLGVSNTVGRIAAGTLANHAWIDCLVVNDVALIAAGGMTLLVPLCTTFIPLAIYAGVYGLCIAMFVSLRSVIVVELMGLDKLTSAFGQLILFHGFAVIAGTPAAGYLRDLTGDYVMSFYVSGSVIAGSGLLCLPLRRVADWERCRQSKLASLSQERLRTQSMSISTIEVVVSTPTSSDCSSSVPTV